MEPKFSAGLWVFANPVDRFCPCGYGEPNTVIDQIEAAAKVPDLAAVECHQTDTDQISTLELKNRLEDKNLACSNVNTNVWGEKKWKLGAFASCDKKLRTEAISEGKRAVDVARKLGSPSIGLWLGSDGFDYPFQINFTHQWDNLICSIREVAEYAAPDIKVGIEYKLKEPRTHMSIGSVGKALSICLELGMENVGVVIDFGHALMSRENPGESVAYLARHRKLFNVHFNDAYGEWDDDMIPGVVHFWETLEFLYYCQQVRYEGWFGLDMFPFREDPVKAADMAIRNIKAIAQLAEKIDVPALLRAQEKMEAIETQEIVRKCIFS
ncbi:MAG: TIM barrel protein [Candidatus Latescibacteria bacterium]|nr:TIM barrel protein [Candidatus Latescibacterota bacterium]